MKKIFPYKICMLLITAFCTGTVTSGVAQEGRSIASLATQVSTLRSAVNSAAAVLRADVDALKSDVSDIRALIDRQKLCGDQKAVYGPSHVDADSHGCVKLDDGLLRLGSTFDEKPPACNKIDPPSPMMPTGLTIRDRKLFAVYTSQNEIRGYTDFDGITNCSRVFDGTSWSDCNCSTQYNWR